MHTNKTKKYFETPKSSHPSLLPFPNDLSKQEHIWDWIQVPLYLLTHLQDHQSPFFLVLVFITTYQDYLGQMKNPIDLKWKVIHNKVQRIQIEPLSHKNIIVFGVFWISFDSFYQMSWRVLKKAHWIGYAIVMVVWFMIFLVLKKKERKNLQIRQVIYLDLIHLGEYQ